MIDRPYSNLARDGQAADVEAFEVRWTPQLPIVGDQDNQKGLSSPANEGTH
jgi:hypothetical protein